MAVAAEQVPEKVVPPPAQTSADPAQFRKLLELAGWNATRFATFDKAGPLADEDQQELVELLWRLKTFDGPQLTDWARAGASGKEIAAAPSEHVGEIVELAGRVTRVERHALSAELAARLEMPAYFECQMMLDGGAGMATILTSRVPKAWLELQSLDEPAESAGVLIRLLSSTNGSTDRLFVSREIAWHPKQPHAPFVSLGESVLGELGVDVGLLDDVRQRRPISAAEREAFYQMLDASGRIGTNQLTRFASQDLDAVEKHWAAEEQRLAATLKDSPPGGNPRDRVRLQLAHEVQARAAKGQYSVAPLFNDAENRVGELVTLDGAARRVTRVDVGTSADGTTSDVARRFGIDHYYEIDVFTEDSQNNPVVFCVRELPPGFPLGDGLQEPVRIAGFFFKSWSFQSRRATLPDAQVDAAPAGDMRQFAPLLIGRGPILIDEADASASDSTGLIAAGLFVVLLGAIWAAGWWLARDDRRFVETTLAKQFSLAEGESLNDVDFDLSESTREHE
ncbi:MAG: hypothetical protein WD971_06270 [Pirellulales bacterium]